MEKGNEEAGWVAWSVWDTVEGARWSVTLREGVTEEAVGDAAKLVEVTTNTLIGAGWRPTVGNAPFQYPPQVVAAPVSKDEQAKLHGLAKQFVAYTAVALGLMASADDTEGAAAIMDAARIKGLPVENMETKAGQWVGFLHELAAERARAELQKAGVFVEGSEGAPQKPTKRQRPARQQPAQQRPVRQQATETDEGDDEAEGSVTFTEIRVVQSSTKSGVKNKLEFWRDGRRFPEFSTYLAADKVLELSEDMASAFDVEDLEDAGRTYQNLDGTLFWKQGKERQGGGHYKDLVGIVLGHSANDDGPPF